MLPVKTTSANGLVEKAICN